VDTRPIGIFDSGAGGLTVLHECLVTLPQEDFVYLGDGARCPYGPRPSHEICRFAHEIASYLDDSGVKLIVRGLQLRHGGRAAPVAGEARGSGHRSARA
jgi:glutamate racemase